MVLAVLPIRKLHVGGRSRRPAGFSLRKQPVSTSLHRGLSPVGYDFALANGDELVSYTVAKPRHAPVRYYTHANHLYSVAATTNTAGQVVERYSYNAYGVRTVKNSAGATLAKSAVNQDRGFTGYKLDSESSLYFARARMYSAKLGRFLERDPFRHLGDLARHNLGGSRIAGMDTAQPSASDGYIDGYNLYCAKFIPNLVDPDGYLGCTATLIETCKAQCKAVGQESKDCKMVDICGLKVAWCYCDGACPPCKNPPAPYSRIDRSPPGRKHFPCPGDHEHFYKPKYNQNKKCDCFLDENEVSVTCL